MSVGTINKVDFSGCNIRSWEALSKQVRLHDKKGKNLLAKLDEFPNSVLVSGCQRSGTTMLSRIITTSDGMVDYWFGKDDELDAALILSGEVNYSPKSSEERHCFQTTYLNERYPEYFSKGQSHKLIWVLRNPYSVVYSMAYNWGSFARNELFSAIGKPVMPKSELEKCRFLGKPLISKLKKSCFSYNGKISQLPIIKETLGADRVWVVDYDELVRNKKVLLPKIYEFIELPYKESYCEKIKSSSIGKADKMSEKHKAYVKEHCIPVYEEMLALVS